MIGAFTITPDPITEAPPAAIVADESEPMSEATMRLIAWLWRDEEDGE